MDDRLEEPESREREARVRAVEVEGDETQAPEGGEALYILVHTAYLRDRHDWRRGQETG